MREKAQKLLNGRELVFALSQGQSCRWEPDAFRRFVELAVEFARDSEQTLIGFLRHERMNVYAMPERIDFDS